MYLLQYLFQIEKLHIFKVYFDVLICVYSEMATTVRSINIFTSHSYCLSMYYLFIVVRTLDIYSLSKFQVYNILLSRITMMYIRFLEFYNSLLNLYCIFIFFPLKLPIYMMCPLSHVISRRKRQWLHDSAQRTKLVAPCFCFLNHHLSASFLADFNLCLLTDCSRNIHELHCFSEFSESLLVINLQQEELWANYYECM